MPFVYIILNRYTKMLTHHKFHGPIDNQQVTPRTYSLLLSPLTEVPGYPDYPEHPEFPGSPGLSGSSGASRLSRTSRLSGRHPPTIKEAVSKVTDTVSCRNNQNSGIVYISLIERDCRDLSDMQEATSSP